MSNGVQQMGLATVIVPILALAACNAATAPSYTLFRGDAAGPGGRAQIATFDSSDRPERHGRDLLNRRNCVTAALLLSEYTHDHYWCEATQSNV